MALIVQFSSQVFLIVPRGLCSLSAFWQYAALDEIEHPSRAAFPRTRLIEMSHRAPLAAPSTRLPPSQFTASRGLDADWRSKIKLMSGRRYRWSVQDQPPNYSQHCHDSRFPR
jgi:hypothetical protein